MSSNKKYERLLAPAAELSQAEVPLYGGIAAGYPAEAYNYIEDRIDLNKLIIRNKSGNRCLWATGRELLGPGIEYSDLLVFDTKYTPGNDSVVCLYSLEDEYSLRWIEKTGDGIRLVCPNPAVSSVYVGEGETVQRLGTLTHRLKKFSNYRRQYGGYPVDAGEYMQKGMDYNNYFLGADGFLRNHFLPEG